MKNYFRKKTAQQVFEELANPEGEKLRRHLTVNDLTIFGVAAIVGAGIFSTIGVAAFHGGAGVSLLFVMTGIACAFAGMAYAEFASFVPVSGSAYTYTYVAFGELPAWLIGWALIMEYSIGSITYAISFSDYLTSFLHNVAHIDLPAWTTTNFSVAKEAYFETLKLNLAAPPPQYLEGFRAYQTAPRLFGLPFIVDIPAIFFVIGIIYIAYRGIKESQIASMIMVGLKIVTLLMVISIGSFYVSSAHWTPFLPNGFGGMLKGVSAVFFAYIGFDAISTTSEECINPQRDIPRAIINSIFISMVLYIAVALVITGMVSHTELNVGDPLALVFTQYPKLAWLAHIVSASGIIAIASTLLIYLIGQPRIWLMMSRDGLLPKTFATIHPRFKTPSVSTICSGFLVGVPALFLDFNFVTDISSAATLVAFIMVCGGVIVLHGNPYFEKRQFKTYFINAKYVLLPTFLIAFYFFIKQTPSVFLLENAPMFTFFALWGAMSVWSFRKKIPLIPTIGLISCLYMLAQLGWKNWLWLGVWFVVGLFIYLGYGVKNSKLEEK